MNISTPIQELKKLHIGNLVGDLSVQGNPDESTHRVRGATGRARYEGGTLSLSNALNDCSLVVPEDLQLEIGNVAGDTHLRNLGDIDITNVSGDLDVNHVKALTLRTTGGDCTLHNINNMVDVRTIGGDFHAEDINGQLTMRSIGGDAHCEKISGSTQIRSIGGDVHCEDIAGSLSIHAIGGDIHAAKIEANLHIKAVGGDVFLSEISGDAVVERVGGDADVHLEFKEDKKYHFSARGIITIHVDDDTQATFNLPEDVPVEFKDFDSIPSLTEQKLVLGNGSATVTIAPDEEHSTEKIVFEHN